MDCKKEQSVAASGPVGPDVTKCKGEWCPPPIDPSKIRDFKFEDYRNSVRRVRRPAHKLDKESIEDFKMATSLMKSLPPDDPRNFLQQANVHGAYCMSAYPVAGRPDQSLMVHGYWLFASFHRWYIYFLERIMGKLINKPSFALPYWNWDHPDGMYIPEMFKDMGSPLYDPNRNVGHLNKVIDLSYNPKTGDNDHFDVSQHIKENTLIMSSFVQVPSVPSLFFGKPYPSTKEEPQGAGSLEVCPHNNVHDWTGDPTFAGGQDMGVLATAGRDPIFYCHHANVDRLWCLWRTQMPDGPRKDLDDPDYLNSYFILYDECAAPVKVYVRDSLDTKKLGYVYEKQDLPWVLPLPSLQVPRKTLTSFSIDPVPFPKRLDSVITTKVARPRPHKQEDEEKVARPRPHKQEDEEEVLLIKFEIRESVQQFTMFNVYVNDDNYVNHQPNQRSPLNPDSFAGSFTMVPHEPPGAHGATCSCCKDFPMKHELRLPITMLLHKTGVSHHDVIKVTIVPISATETIFITHDVNIDFVA